MRFHILGLGHTATNKLYSVCAFTQKALNLCKMLKLLGHEVIHYANEGSEVVCDELVTILPKDKILPPEKLLDWDKPYSQENQTLFNYITTGEIAKRKRPGDFLLCPWSVHKPIAERYYSDMIVVESGIGYAGNFFAPYKVFESYAILHAYYGLVGVTNVGKLEWYSRVIPNYFDPDDFEAKTDCKDGYLLFLGMRHGGHGKGLNVAMQVAEATKRKLIACGPHPPEIKVNPNYFEYLGPVGVEKRKMLLKHARALMAPSQYAEPFCGTQIEAYFSGTPVISTDWGAFAEYNLQGITGYRCNTFKEFLDAVDRVDSVEMRNACVEHSKKFTLEAVGKQYDYYFKQCVKTKDGSKGWYDLEDI